jgi:hypothetical protein
MSVYGSPGSALHMIMEFVIFAWIGAIVMFTVTVSPTVFEVLDAQDAGRFLRLIFQGCFGLKWESAE